jgi:hypothetical protein
LIPEWVLIHPSFEDKWVPILASEYMGVQVLMMKILAIVENNFIGLAWALTVWKAQVTLIKGLKVLIR